MLKIGKILVAGLCIGVLGTMAATAQEAGTDRDVKAQEAGADKAVKAQEFRYDWGVVAADGSRTGVTVKEMGEAKCGKFTGPNGRTFRGGATPKAARLMRDAQPYMAEVKEVIGYSTYEMKKHRPESALSDMVVDVVMDCMEKETGREVDMGIYNFGGIRVDMPQGDIIWDDIMSMLPFTNYPVYIVLKGSEVRYWLEKMGGNMQAIGGARVVVKDKKLVEATIQGEPIDDEKEYGVVTIDFLLNGGDGLYLGRNALETITSKRLSRDMLKEYIQGLTAEGKQVEYKTDGRVKVL